MRLSNSCHGMYQLGKSQELWEDKTPKCSVTCRRGGWNQGRQPREQGLGLKSNTSRAIFPGALELQSYAAIRQHLQPFIGQGRPKDLPAQTLTTLPIMGRDATGRMQVEGGVLCAKVPLRLRAGLGMWVSSTRALTSSSPGAATKVTTDAPRNLSDIPLLGDTEGLSEPPGPRAHFQQIVSMRQSKYG